MCREIPDHPVIVNLERTGHPSGQDPESPNCPVCGEECEKIYRVKADREVIGCDHCIEGVDPWEVRGE